ncbi:oxidoreductase [Sporocytophaga myxococcoides]|uniref:Oxidoreductase n=1 Tax=Sporocytophaga myxococcoides TaxID=153721 RepID=A0A098LHP2_9BACT|nr:SDR family oxidoreductase [Sporocytophaga myxococcoides]GAL85964.1 oxidoreductase [Sporocytophaga myxococcoides]
MANDKKYALITGGTSGIGLELAKLFAQEGFNLVLVARDFSDLQAISAEFKHQFNIDVTTIEKDLSKKEAPFEVCEEIRSKNIQIDILVNNAGQGAYGKFSETDVNRELEIIQLNIAAYVVLTKYFLKDMLSRNEGRILNVASIAGKMPGPWQSVYHGTKAFVVSWTEAILQEIKDTNITITTLLPGATATDFFHKADMEESTLVQKGDLADPAEVAKDGYKALMAGEHKIVSGWKNKAQVVMSNILPDKAVLEMSEKQNKPA